MIQSHAHAREYGTHACMKAHILEHVYGEKPYMSKRKPRRGDFANVALNHQDIQKHKNTIYRGAL